MIARSLSILALATAAHAEPTLVLRGNEPAPAGLVVSSVGLAGVALAPAEAPAGTPATLIIGWDRIRSVSGEAANQAAPYLDLADRAWRARTRLERGDAPSAEPLLEALFPAVSGAKGPTSAMVAEALFRVRLARGANVAAVEPMVVRLAMEPAKGSAWLHENWGVEAGLGEVIDAELGLAPALPPIWLRNAALDALANKPVAEVSGRAQAIAAWYTLAARLDAGQPIAGPFPEATDAGSEILRDIVLARAGSAEQRESARGALASRIRIFELPPREGTPTDRPRAWLEAWLRVAIGRSLIAESNVDQRAAGVVHLLHLPARLGRDHPYLTGLALAEASVAVRELGDAAGADRLAGELFQRFPSHPAVDWPPLAVARAPRGVPATPAEDLEP